MKYEPLVIEEKWQKKWEDENSFKVTEDPQKLSARAVFDYKLVMTLVEDQPIDED